MLSFAFSRRLAPRHSPVRMLPILVFALSRLFEASAASLRSGCSPLPFLSRRRLAPRHISGLLCYPCSLRSRAEPAPLLSRGVQLRGILRSACYPCPFRPRTAPASFCSLAASAPRHRSGKDATRPGLFFLAALSGASAASSVVRMLPSFVFAFSRLFEASAASLRSGCSPLPLLSRGVELRGILWSACYPLLFRSRRRQLRGIAQVRMLPVFVFAFSRLFEASAASLRSGCSPLSFLSRRRQLRGITQVSMLPLSVTARTVRPALSRRVLPLV
jgi:hypothetical protein